MDVKNPLKTDEENPKPMPPHMHQGLKTNMED